MSDAPSVQAANLKAPPGNSHLAFEKPLLRIQHDIVLLELEQTETGRDHSAEIKQQKSQLRTRMKRLIGNEPRLGERLEVHSMTDIGMRLYEANFGRAKLAADEEVRGLLGEASEGVEGNRGVHP